MAFVLLQPLALVGLAGVKWIVACLTPQPGFAPRLPDEALLAAGGLLLLANVVLALAMLDGARAEGDAIDATGWLIGGGLALLAAPLVPIAIAFAQLGEIWPVRAC